MMLLKELGLLSQGGDRTGWTAALIPAQRISLHSALPLSTVLQPGSWKCLNLFWSTWHLPEATQSSHEGCEPRSVRLLQGELCVLALWTRGSFPVVNVCWTGGLFFSVPDFYLPCTFPCFVCLIFVLSFFFFFFLFIKVRDAHSLESQRTSYLLWKTAISCPAHFILSFSSPQRQPPENIFCVWFWHRLFFQLSTDA